MQFKLKDILINILLFFFFTLLSLLIINLLLFKLSNNQKIPRPLASSLNNYLFTFYPDTYNKSNFEDYTAILGDSNAMGSGEAYISNIYDYSIAHHLYKINKKNYLNFARGGYGSISSVSNLIKIYQLDKNIFLAKKIKKPISVLFFFYEGNDLQENIKEYNLFKDGTKNIKEFVYNRINKNIIINKKDLIQVNFPVLNFFNTIKFQLSKLFSEIINSDNYAEIIDKILLRLKKIKGETVILSNKELLENNSNNNWTNKTINNNLKKIRPIESAPVDLTKKEKEISLEIFFESIIFLKSWIPNKDIKIIYLPSPATSYQWEDPIKYYPRYLKNNLKYKETTTKKNEFNSKFIRNKIEKFSEENDFVFIDLTKKIQQKTNNTILHGPNDWVHFNYDGYKHIAENILK